VTRNSQQQPMDLATRLAIQRTRQAADRTLMAWMRTSTSMISFGFSISKLFETLKPITSPAHEILNDKGPFAVGALLIVLAIVFLVSASIEYQLELKRLGRESGQVLPVSTAQVAATGMSLLGMVALANLLWQF
jgi:putative membrane protein